MLKQAFKAFRVFLPLLIGPVFVYLVVTNVPEIKQMYRDLRDYGLPECPETIDEDACMDAETIGALVSESLGMPTQRAGVDSLFIVTQEVGVGYSLKPTWRTVFRVRLEAEHDVIPVTYDPRFSAAYDEIEVKLQRMLTRRVCGSEDKRVEGNSDLAKFLQLRGALEYAIIVTAGPYNTRPFGGPPAFDRFHSPPKEVGLLGLLQGSLEMSQVTIGPVTLQSCEDMP